MGISCCSADGIYEVPCTLLWHIELHQIVMFNEIHETTFQPIVHDAVVLPGNVHSSLARSNPATGQQRVSPDQQVLSRPVQHAAAEKEVPNADNPPLAAASSKQVPRPAAAASEPEMPTSGQQPAVTTAELPGRSGTQV